MIKHCKVIISKPIMTNTFFAAYMDKFKKIAHLILFVSLIIYNGK